MFIFVVVVAVVVVVVVVKTDWRKVPESDARSVRLSVLGVEEEAGWAIGGVRMAWAGPVADALYIRTLCLHIDLTTRKRSDCVLRHSLLITKALFVVSSSCV